MTMMLDKTSALVTGASRGLGAALARSLARRGVRVVLVARGGDELDQVVESIRASGGDAHGIVADVADKEAVYAIAGSAAALVGPIDLLIHNASTLGPVPLPILLDTACEDLEQVLAVNLVGPFRLSKAIAGSMVLRGRGLLVHISSDAAVSAYSGWGAYGVSKAALDHLARVFAAELEGTGVKTLSIDPGEMDTRMHADAIPDADRTALADPQVVAERIVRAIERDRGLQSGSRLLAVEMEVTP
jgi:NAD(P)-dependent dehydrogenase (short-subunit alcohol dehydrogenase family)